MNDLSSVLGLISAVLDCLTDHTSLVIMDKDYDSEHDSNMSESFGVIGGVGDDKKRRGLYVYDNRELTEELLEKSTKIYEFADTDTKLVYFAI